MTVLENVTILDCAQYATGPYATLLLSYMGATVIKVEAPTGDLLRKSTVRYQEKQISYPFVLLNRSKQGVTLNLKTARGQELFKELAKQADVVVENFVPGTMEKWGLTYDVLSAINPRLILASVNGFGRGSKYEKLPAFDVIIQAMGGSMASASLPGTGPIRSIADYADFGAATHLALAIMGALLQRSQTGRGQQLEVAMRDTVLYMPLGVHNIYHESGRVVKDVGNRVVGVSPINTYKAADGHVYIMAMTNATANAVMKAIGHDAFTADEKYASPYTRWRNRQEVDQLIEAWTSSRNREEIVNIMKEHDVPCGSVMPINEVWADDDLRQREQVVTIDQPELGRIDVLGSPIRLEGQQERYEPAPLLGQHNDEVYGRLLGLSEIEIQGLREDGVL